MSLSVGVVLGFIVVLAALLYIAFKGHDIMRAAVQRQKGDFKPTWQKKKRRKS
jgi:uncharacterized membrane protein